MVQLPQSNYAAHKALQEGDFVVARSTKLFAKIPVDQTIEQTFNRESKTPGGITGFSPNPGAVERWVLTAHESTKAAGACLDLAGLSQDASHTRHKDSMQHRRTRDRHDLESISSALTEYGNPFLPGDIVSLSTRQIPRQDICKDIRSAFAIGENALQSFIDNRLIKSVVGFFEPMKKTNLGRFRSKFQRISKAVSNAKETASQAGLFRQLVIMAQVRTLDMRTILQHELGPPPLSLANTVGSPISTQKSVFLHALEEGIAPAEHVPEDAALVVDAMALIRGYTSIPTTFGKLSIQILRHLVSLLTQYKSCRLYFVADEQHTLSIKSFERKSRSKASTDPIRVNVQRPNQPIPSDWSRFMSNSGNKTDLIRFLARHWSEDQAALQLKPGHTIFVTVGKECWRFKVTQEGQYSYSSVPELKSTQEEGDTRMFLHAHHAFSSGYSTVVIRSMDTDVFVLALGLLFSLPGQVLLMTGSKAKARVIDINKVAASLGQ